MGRSASLQQHGHRAGGLDVGGGHRPLRSGIGDDHPAEPRFEIGKVAREAEDGHHFGGDGDVETVLARKAVGDAAERRDDLAQRAIVDVERAAPDDAARIDVERIAPIDMIVDHRREQIVGGGDGVEIAGEMQVDFVHRHDLRMAAAGRAALAAEHRAERRLAQADHRALAEPRQRVAEPDRRRRLALAGRRRVDRGDEDELAVGPAAQAFEETGSSLAIERP